MTDSIRILQIPLVPTCQAAHDFACAGWRERTSALYMLKTNGSQLSAHLRMYAEKFPHAKKRV